MDHLKNADKLIAGIQHLLFPDDTLLATLKPVDQMKVLTEMAKALREIVSYLQGQHTAGSQGQ